MSLFNLEPFLNTGVTSASLSLVGKIPEAKESLIIIDRGLEIWSLRSFSKLVGILFGPTDLLEFNNDIVVVISDGVTGDRKIDC